MAKKSKTKSSYKNTFYASGVVLVGAVAIGLGVGYLTNNVPGYGLLGLGSGLVLASTMVLAQKRTWF